MVMHAKRARIVLIVDGETAVAETCARVLERTGFHCLLADDCAGAFSLFDAFHPSLVLSDINFPAGDGFEIVRYVRQKSQDTPVVLMTADPSSFAFERAAREGAAGCLRKPFANAELIATVKSLLR